MSLIKIGGKPPPDFDDPIGMLRACHRRIEGHLATAARAAELLRAGPDAAAQAALGEVIGYFDVAGARHTLDEEASLFPRMQHPAIAALTAEHRTHEAIYLAWKRAAERVAAGERTQALLDDLASHGAAMAAAYADHIRVEESELFPAAETLDARELRAIGLEMRIRRG